MTGTASGESKITVKLLMTMCSVFFFPMMGFGFYTVLKLNGIEHQLVVLSGQVSRNGMAVDETVTFASFSSWIREARALGYPDLPDPHQ